jgi:uncharacterized peroxidase-related enzyme
LTKNNDLVEALKTDYRQAALNAADLAMLDYAAVLTLTPTAITESHLQALRDAGFNDRAILDIALIIAYFAYVNRIADGLGVSLEAYWDHGDTP